MKENEYTCLKCGGTYESSPDWTREKKEYEENFGHIPQAESFEEAERDDQVICDDCYNQFSYWYENEYREEDYENEN